MAAPTAGAPSSDLRFSLRFGSLASHGVVRKEDEASTAKDAVAPTKHGPTCAMLGGGETWTKNSSGHLYPVILVNLCNQLSHWDCFQNGFHVSTCVIEHTTKSDNKCWTAALFRSGRNVL